MKASALVVVAIRAQALSDELQTALNLARISKLFAPRRMHDPFYANGPDLDWAAQRLRSTCERELGTRGRPYDRE